MEGGEQRHRLHAFVRDGDVIRHHGCSEALPPNDGQEPRLKDLIWPLWHRRDVTPEGRGSDSEFLRCAIDAALAPISDLARRSEGRR